MLGNVYVPFSAVVRAAFLSLVCAAAMLGPVCGGEAQRSAGPPPLAVASVASVERVLDDVDYVFETAERPDVSQVVRGVLAALGDLRGLDRERPIGAMLLLQPGLAPRPVVVGFVPVKNIDELRQSFTLGIEIRKVEGSEDQYEIITPERTLYGRLAGGYGFIAAEKEILNREFPDPAELVREEMSAYDAAASLRLGNVPQGIKILILDYLRARAAAELQQREGESTPQFALRKAAGESTLESLEQGLSEGQALTIGWRLSRDDGAAELELRFDAKSGTRLAGALRATGGTAGRFGGAVSKSSPFSLGISWMLDERSRGLVAQGLALAEEQAQRRYQSDAGAPLYDALEAIAREGHLNAFVQFAGEPPGPLAIVGALRLAEGSGLAESLPGLLRTLASAQKEAFVQTSAERHNGVALHRIAGKAPPRNSERLFGANPALYVGADSEALWFALGGERAMPALREAMDRAASPPDPSARNAGAPFRTAVHAGQWVATLGSDLGNSQAERELMRDAFAKGHDAAQIEVLTGESSLRLRLRLEEGFVRLVGLGIVRQMDRR